MHPSPALVPRLSALVRAAAKPPPLRLALEHAETHAPLASLRNRGPTTAAATTPPQTTHHLHPHPLTGHSHANHPFRQPRKYLFFTTLNRRTEPLPAPMIEWNDHLSMV